MMRKVAISSSRPLTDHGEASGAIKVAGERRCSSSLELQYLHANSSPVLDGAGMSILSHYSGQEHSVMTQSNMQHSLDLEVTCRLALAGGGTHVLSHYTEYCPSDQGVVQGEKGLSLCTGQLSHHPLSSSMSTTSVYATLRGEPPPLEHLPEVTGYSTIFASSLNSSSNNSARPALSPLLGSPNANADSLQVSDPQHRFGEDKVATSCPVTLAPPPPLLQLVPTSVPALLKVEAPMTETATTQWNNAKGASAEKCGAQVDVASSSISGASTSITLSSPPPPPLTHAPPMLITSDVAVSPGSSGVVFTSASHTPVVVFGPSQGKHIHHLSCLLLITCYVLRRMQMAFCYI